MHVKLSSLIILKFWRQLGQLNWYFVRKPIVILILYECLCSFVYANIERLEFICKTVRCNNNFAMFLEHNSFKVSLSWHIQLLSFWWQFFHFFIKLLSRSLGLPAFLNMTLLAPSLNLFFPEIYSCSVKRVFVILWSKLLNCWSSSKTIWINSNFSFDLFQGLFSDISKVVWKTFWFRPRQDIIMRL